MRYDPTEPTTPVAPAPKARRAPKLVHTPAMKAFAGLSNAMLQIMAPCSPQDVDQVRADFLAHLQSTNATDWRSAWQTWRSTTSPVGLVAPREPVQEPATCNLPPEPPVSVPTPQLSTHPLSTHPWLQRLQQRRRQLGLQMREPGTLAIA